MDVDKFISNCVQVENENHALRRRVQLLEDSNEQLESRLSTALQQLQQASNVVDEHERLLHTISLVYNLCSDVVLNLAIIIVRVRSSSFASILYWEFLACVFKSKFLALPQS